MPASILSPLHRAILRTLAYYDIFDYPLTRREVWRWLYPEPAAAVGQPTLAEVEIAIDSSPLKPYLERLHDFVFLKGRSAIVETRLTRMAENEKKWKRALSAARFLEIIPFVKLVAVVNTLAINNARPESDMDFFIVTSPGHIWIARFMVTGIVSMLGYRRHGTNIANRICLSFYVTTTGLDLERLKDSEPDHHFAFWASQAVLLMDDGGMYERYKEKNAWVKKQLPNGWEWDWKDRLLAPNAGWRSIKKLYEAFFSSPIGAWLEQWARQNQLKRFAKDTKSKSQLPTNDVVISEEVLKFHEADRRKEYNQKFEAKLKELGL